MAILHGYITPIFKVIITTVIITPGGVVSTEQKAGLTEFVNAYAQQYYEVDGVAPQGYELKAAVLQRCYLQLAKIRNMEQTAALATQNQLKASLGNDLKIAVIPVVYGECKVEEDQAQ